jgi:hypothetical protein
MQKVEGSNPFSRSQKACICRSFWPRQSDSASASPGTERGLTATPVWETLRKTLLCRHLLTTRTTDLFPGRRRSKVRCELPRWTKSFPRSSGAPMKGPPPRRLPSRDRSTLVAGRRLSWCSSRQAAATAAPFASAIGPIAGVGRQAALSVERDDDLAVGAALLDVRQRLERLVERERLVDERAQLAGVVEGGQLAQLGAVGLHEQERVAHS